MRGPGTVPLQPGPCRRMMLSCTRSGRIGLFRTAHRSIMPAIPTKQMLKRRPQNRKADTFTWCWATRKGCGLERPLWPGRYLAAWFGAQFADKPARLHWILPSFLWPNELSTRTNWVSGVPLSRLRGGIRNRSQSLSVICGITTGAVVRRIESRN